MARLELTFEDEPEEEVTPVSPEPTGLQLEFQGEEHLSEPRPRGIDGEMYADPYSNLEKMGERLSQRWKKTGAGLGAMAANQEMPTSTEEMAEGVLPPVDGDWKDWAMYSPHGEMLNQVSSMVMSGVVDVGDMVRRGDLREDLRTANEIVRKEADATLGADYMQYEGNVGQKFGWDVAEATVNMGGAVAVGWATRNPGLALGVIAGEVGGTAYTDYLGKTGSHDRAMAAAKFHTYAEIIPETIPVLAILRKTGAGDGMRRFLEGTLGEGAQELLTSILTQTYDAKELENMSLKEAILNIDWGDVAYEGLIGTFVGGILSTPGTASDYIQYKAEAEGRPPPSGPAPPDFDVKSVEENQTAIDEALADTPDDPAGDFEPGEAGPEIEVEAGSIAGEPVLTETEQAAQDLRDQLDAADAEETVKTPEDLANDEWVAQQLRDTYPDMTEEEVQQAVVAHKPQTKEDMGWVAPVEEGESKDVPAEPEGMTEIDGKILPDPRDEKGAAWVAPEDVEPASTPAAMTPVPEQKQPDDERGGMMSEPAEQPPAEPWAPVEEGKTDGLESYRDKARSDFEKHGVSDRDRMTKVEALGKNVSKEAADAYDSTYADLVEKAVAERVASQTDEITRAELIATTENVETTGEAVQVSEEYRTAQPEFKDLVLSFKPGDDRHGVVMKHYYGEVGGTEDADGMPIDVMLNKDYKTEPWLSSIFVINQMDPESKEFKQHKVMAGFSEMEPAETAYMEQWGEDSWDSTYELTPEEFEEWRASGDHQNAFEPYAKVPDTETGGVGKSGKNVGEVSASDAAAVSPDDFDAMLEDTETVEPIGRPQQPTLAEHEAAQDKADETEAGRRRRGTELARKNREINETDDLVDFIRKSGGLNVDNQSDIKAVNLEDLNDRRSIGVPNLIQHNDAGASLSTLTEAAWEAGYIKENDETLLINALHAAATNPVYNAAGMDADMQRQQDVEDARLSDEHIEALENDADDMAAYMIEQSGGPKYSSEEIPELIGLAADADYGAVLDITFDTNLSEDEVITKLQEIIDGEVTTTSDGTTVATGEIRSEPDAASAASEGAQEATGSAPAVPETAPETTTETASDDGSTRIRGIPISPRMEEAIGLVGREKFTKRLKKRGNRLGAQKGTRHLQNVADGLAAQIISENWEGAPDTNENGVFVRDNPNTIEMIYEGLKKDRTTLELRVMQVSENLWTYGHNIMLKNSGSSSGMSWYSITDSKEEAQLINLRTAKNHVARLAEPANDGVSSKASVAEGKRALKWVNEQIESISPAAEPEVAEVAAPKKKKKAAKLPNIDEMSKEELEAELGYDSTMQDADYLRKLLERKRAEQASEPTVDSTGQTDPFAPDAGQQQAIEGKKGENAMSDAQKKVAQKMGTGVTTPANAQSADDIFADEQGELMPLEGDAPVSGTLVEPIPFKSMGGIVGNEVELSAGFVDYEISDVYAVGDDFKQSAVFHWDDNGDLINITQTAGVVEQEVVPYEVDLLNEDDDGNAIQRVFNKNESGDVVDEIFEILGWEQHKTKGKDDIEGTVVEQKLELAAPITKQHLVEHIPEDAYKVGDKYIWGGFWAKVTGIERPEEGRPSVLLEYTEGPLKGRKTYAPGHLKELQDDLVEPFDIQTTEGTIRITVSWAYDPVRYNEVYDTTGGMMSIALHGPNHGGEPGTRGVFRSVAGVPISGTNEELVDPVYLKETATMIANSALADHFGKPTHIIGRPLDTMGEVLERSRDIPAGQQPLSKISITVEGEGKKVSHKAKWWVDAIDKRLEKVAQLRTCR